MRLFLTLLLAMTKYIEGRSVMRNSQTLWPTINFLTMDGCADDNNNLFQGCFLISCRSFRRLMQIIIMRVICEPSGGCPEWVRWDEMMIGSNKPRSLRSNTHDAGCQQWDHWWSEAWSLFVSIGDIGNEVINTWTMCLPGVEVRATRKRIQRKVHGGVE